MRPTKTAVCSMTCDLQWEAIVPMGFHPIPTWNHAMQVLDVLLGDAALRAHLIYEAGDEPGRRVGDVAVLRVLEATLSIKALGHAARDAVGHRAA